MLAPACVIEKAPVEEFQGIEYSGYASLRRSQRAVDFRIVMGEVQRYRVGRAAQHRVIPAAQLSRQRRERHKVCIRGRSLGIKDDLEILFSCDGAGASCDCAPQRIEAIVIVCDGRSVLVSHRHIGQPTSAQRHIHRGLRQFGIEAALIELSHQRPFPFVAFLEEGGRGTQDPIRQPPARYCAAGPRA